MAGHGVCVWTLKPQTFLLMEHVMDTRIPKCLSLPYDLTFLPRHGRSEELSLLYGIAEATETRHGSTRDTLAVQILSQR